jgi:AcrR family transcriptional regulator
MVRNRNDGSNTATLPRADRKALEKRRAILRAAARAFRTHGLAATGMREIAAAADLSPANLYYYFESRDELLFFCQDASLDRLLEAVREPGEKRASEQMRRVIEAHLACTLDELDAAAAHLEIDALPQKLRAAIVEKRDRYERALRRIVQRGQRSGEFAAGDAGLITRAILGSLNWASRWYRPDGPKTVADVSTTFSDYLVRGLLR